MNNRKTKYKSFVLKQVINKFKRNYYHIMLKWKRMKLKQTKKGYITNNDFKTDNKAFNKFF